MSPTSNAGRTIGIVLGVTAISVVGLVAVSILAVTFLGRSASSRFSSVGTAIVDPPVTRAGSTWTTYSAADRSFTASFPGPPKLRDDSTREPGTTVIVTSYQVLRTAGLVEVVVLTLSPGMVSDDATIDDAINTMADAQNGKIVARSVGMTNEGPATDVEISSSNSVSLVRVIRTDKHVYLLHMATAAGDRQEFAKLTDSFHIPS